ncbi:MAG: nucleotide exchange factor GrpE [Myxococcota bacterium]|nr:nucleotide exchange factor GrpE [Myxococcota bacterium]
MRQRATALTRTLSNAKLSGRGVLDHLIHSVSAGSEMAENTEVLTPEVEIVDDSKPASETLEWAEDPLSPEEIAMDEDAFEDIEVLSDNSEPPSPELTAALVEVTEGDVDFLEVADFDDEAPSETVSRSEHDALHEQHQSLRTEHTQLASERDNLQEECLRVQAELRMSQQRLARLAADFDNYKRRIEREREDQRRLLTERVLLDILPVNDNLERALGHVKSSDDRESLVQGVEMVQKQLVNVLGRHGCAPFDSVGMPFDPQRHEAIQQMESELYPVNVVLEEYHRGYVLNDHLLRAALVVVSKGPGPAKAAPRSTEQSTESDAELPDEAPIAVEPSGEAWVSRDKSDEEGG